jgi:uncharacterized membrane protein (UPF0127 family)
VNRNALLIVAVVGTLALAGCTGGPSGATPTDTIETTTTSPDSETNGTGPQVELRDSNGTVLGTVSVAIADNGGERQTGLSKTEQLNESEGMLFVYNSSQRNAVYVMRNMSFPLDIVFVASNGTITTIHHAATEPGESGDALTHYPGSGQYVLEVNRGYANRTGLSVGDTVAIPAGIATSDATPNPDGQ